MNNQIFISLTQDDEEIGEAIRYVLDELLGPQVEVRFSTSSALETGVRHGEDWVSWIADRVRTCDFVLMLMTPTSARKPWILWEGGAAYGAALAAKGKRKIRPLLYRTPEEEIPSPLREMRFQYKVGDHRSDVISLFTDIVDGYRGKIQQEVYHKAIALLQSEKNKAVETVSHEANKSLEELQRSGAIIGAYFTMVNSALDKARALVPPEYWHRGLFENSSYPLTAVLVLDAKEGNVPDAEIQRASFRAERFYGFPANSGALNGRNLGFLMSKLESWMNPDDFEAFVKDQRENAERFADGMLSSARQPIVFNEKHPVPELRGKSFLPLTLHQSCGEGGSPFMTVLYLDLEELPRDLGRRLQSE